MNRSKAISGSDPDSAAHDAVMSWLQDRELRDHKLSEARSGKVSTVFISTAIGRLQEKAYLAFPDIDRNTIDGFVRKYVDPHQVAH